MLQKVKYQQQHNIKIWQQQQQQQEQQLQHHLMKIECHKQTTTTTSPKYSKVTTATSPKSTTVATPSITTTSLFGAIAVYWVIFGFVKFFSLSNPFELCSVACIIKLLPS